MAAHPFRAELKRMDAELRSGRRLGPELLSRVPLEVLGDLYLGLLPEYPALTAALPAMAPAQVQRDWTGSDGKPLMVQSCAFIESVTTAFQRHVRRPLDGATVLDHGCGWGRLLRLILRYTPAEKIWGLDPWDRSIELCREARIPVHLAICDYVPRTLPVGDVRFDLIFAFSVFTHLSPGCAARVMETLRAYLQPGGLLAITIRPPEYWPLHQPLPPGVTAESLLESHRDAGFAFIPHNRPAIDGDVTYGDASYSLEYVRRVWKGWRVLEARTNAVDPLQTVVFLQPTPI